MVQANNTSTPNPSAVVDHGDPNLLCQTGWLSILTFYLVNYVAHCATVKAYPAEPDLEFINAVAFALFFPLSGVIRALDSINRRARFSKKNDLQQAARAGALCMVVRSQDWRPQLGDCIVGTKVVTSTDDNNNESLENKFTIKYPPWHYEPLETSLPHGSIFDRGCKVHGIYLLPPGYELMLVPSDAKVCENPSEEGVSIEVASTYSLVKTAVAIVQTAYAAVTLVRTRGNQIQLFGYASFGLTVTPYLVMSLLNLIGQLVTPDYSHLYLVGSPEMNEAKSRGGVFDGVIGSLVLPQRSKDIEEWTVEAALTSESATNTNNEDEVHDSWTQNASASEDVELANLSRECTPLMLRESTLENSELRLLRLEQSESVQTTLVEKVYGCKIIIPRCSPYERLSSARFSEDMKSRSYHKSLPRKENDNLTLTIPLAISLISLIVNGAFSHFRKGSSTVAQRAWTMSWLVVNISCGSILFHSLVTYHSGLSVHQLDPKTKKRKRDPWFVFWHYLFFVLFFGIFFAPAIGGFVVVGQMISQYGNCEQI